MTSFLSSSSSTCRRPPAFIQALFLLFGCVFVVYQMEDIAIDSLDNINRGQVRPPIMAAFSIASAAEDDDMDSDQDEFKVQFRENTSLQHSHPMFLCSLPQIAVQLTPRTPRTPRDSG
jgi:hypothetical protein